MIHGYGWLQDHDLRDRLLSLSEAMGLPVDVAKARLFQIDANRNAAHIFIGGLAFASLKVKDLDLQALQLVPGFHISRLCGPSPEGTWFVDLSGEVEERPVLASVSAARLGDAVRLAILDAEIKSVLLRRALLREARPDLGNEAPGLLSFAAIEAGQILKPTAEARHDAKERDPESKAGKPSKKKATRRS